MINHFLNSSPRENYSKDNLFCALSSPRVIINFSNILCPENIEDESSIHRSYSFEQLLITRSLAWKTRFKLDRASKMISLTVDDIVYNIKHRLHLLSSQAILLIPLV